jgi:hypothetical protein
VQIDSLKLDERATIRRAAEFHETLSARADHEARVLREHAARFVVVDAAPLGCAAAATAGIASVVVSNFTWDWIYEAYREHLGSAPELLRSIRQAYRQADAAWRLPMHGGFATFDALEDLPFVARHAKHTREDVRQRLGLPLDRRLVLSSFGGYGVSGLDVTRLDCLGEYGVLFTRRDDEPAVNSAPAGVLQISESRLYGSGLRYEDLVAACDVVATKPGYGIIAECIANGTAMLYTSRGQFAEYDVLVAEMPRYLRCGYLDHQALLAGAWRRVLDGIMSAPAPAEHPRTDGAQVVAQRISEWVRSLGP